MRACQSAGKVFSTMVGLFALLWTPGEVESQENIERHQTPKMNVIFLDDGAARLTADEPLKRNDWAEWEKRVPTFLGLLNKFVGDFQRASGDQVGKTDSLFTLEVAEALSPELKEQVIARELERVFQATGRRSAILARSTAGDDQLRLVFQDEKDYRPTHAAKFLRNLAEISPAVAHSGIAEHFGPFQPPPTIVFDPREPSLVASTAGTLPRKRWALVETETYLLPHYLLHSLALLSQYGTGEKTFYDNSVPEPGASTFVHNVLYGPEAHLKRIGPDAGFTRVPAADYVANPDGYVGKNISIMVGEHDWRSAQQVRDIQQQRQITSNWHTYGFVPVENSIKRNLTVPDGSTLTSWEPRSRVAASNYLLDNPYKTAEAFGKFWHENRAAVMVTETPSLNEFLPSYIKGSKSVGDDSAVPNVTRFSIDMNSGGVGGGVGPFSAGLQGMWRNALSESIGVPRSGEQLTSSGWKSLKPQTTSQIVESLPQFRSTDHGLGGLGGGPNDSFGRVPSTSPLSQFGVRGFSDLTAPEISAAFDNVRRGQPPFGGGPPGGPDGLGARYSFSDISLRATPQKLQTAFLSLRSEPDRFIKPAGILLDAKNIYIWDPTGAIHQEGQRNWQAARDGDGTYTSGGRKHRAAAMSIYGDLPKPSQPEAPAELAIRLTGNLFMLQGDLICDRDGSLPFAVARFLVSPAEPGPRFGGPWSFEPVMGIGLEALSDHAVTGKEQAEVVVLPAETYSRLAYVPLYRTSAENVSGKSGKVSIVGFVKKDSRFQPELIPYEDGSFDWRLRHGVTITLDSAGLVKSIREPDGHEVKYVRADDGRLLGKRTSDNRSVQIEYQGRNPTVLKEGERTAVTYNCPAGLLRTVTCGSEQIAIGYDDAGRPRAIRCGSHELVVTHDFDGRLQSVSAEGQTVEIDYVKDRNAIRIADGRKAVDWRFGPPRGRLIGVVMGNRVIVWTVHSEGRIIQVALGHLQAVEGSSIKRFIVDETIGTMKKTTRTRSL